MQLPREWKRTKNQKVEQTKMPNIPIPNPGFVQVFKEDMLLTLQWDRMQAGQTIQYSATAGVVKVQWSSDEIDITANSQDDAIVEGAWKGLNMHLPGLWGEMLITPDHLRMEMRNRSHPQTFKEVSEVGRDIWESFQAAEARRKSPVIPTTAPGITPTTDN